MLLEISLFSINSNFQTKSHNYDPITNQIIFFSLFSQSQHLAFIFHHYFSSPHHHLPLSLVTFFFLIPFCGFWWHLFIGSFCPHLMFTPNPPPLFSHMKISYKKKKKKSIFQVFPFSSSTNPTV